MKPAQIFSVAYVFIRLRTAMAKYRAANLDLTAKTFHSLGMHIISQVEGEVPSINKMAEDDRLRIGFVDDRLKCLLEDELYKSRFVTYFFTV